MAIAVLHFSSEEENLWLLLLSMTDKANQPYGQEWTVIKIRQVFCVLPKLLDQPGKMVKFEWHEAEIGKTCPSHKLSMLGFSLDSRHHFWIPESSGYEHWIAFYRHSKWHPLPLKRGFSKNSNSCSQSDFRNSFAWTSRDFQVIRISSYHIVCLCSTVQQNHKEIKILYCYKFIKILQTAP